MTISGAVMNVLKNEGPMPLSALAKHKQLKPLLKGKADGFLGATLSGLKKRGRLAKDDKPGSPWGFVGAPGPLAELAEAPRPTLPMRFAIGLSEFRPKLPTDARKKLDRAVAVLGLEPCSEWTFTVTGEGEVLWAAFCKLPVEAMKNVIANHNAHNRPTGADKIARFASHMRPGGNWPLTGATIMFGLDGQLLDGQGRIKAALQIGESLYALVAVGGTFREFDVIDSGETRSIEQRLVTFGETYAKVRSQTLMLLHRFEKSSKIRDHIARGTRDAVYDGVVARRLNDHYGKSLNDALEFVNGLLWGLGTKVLPKHIVAFFMMQIARLSKPAAQHFLQLVVEGGGGLGHPTTAVRNRLIRLSQRSKEQRAKAKMSLAAEHLKLLGLAWNSFAQGVEDRNDEDFVGKNPAWRDNIFSLLSESLSTPKPEVIEAAQEDTPQGVSFADRIAKIKERAKAVVQIQQKKLLERASDPDGEFAASVARKLQGI